MSTETLKTRKKTRKSIFSKEKPSNINCIEAMDIALLKEAKSQFPEIFTKDKLNSEDIEKLERLASQMAIEAIKFSLD